MPSRRSVLVMAAVSALGATGCGGDPDLAADSRSRDAQPASAPVPRNSSALGREVLDLGPRPVIPGRPLLGAYAGHARPDGSLVVAGEAPVAGRSQTVLAIVGPSGRLIARYSLPGVDSVNGIAERPDDRLVVAGYSEADRQVRLFGRTAGGAPDGSFGRGGTVATGLTAACPRCADAFTDAAGTVTVAAATYGQPLKVRRYTASGTPDQGFAAGQAASPPGAASDVQIAEDPDGGTIVLRVDDSYKATLHRITGAGVVDPYFGRDGSVALPGDGSFSSLAVRPDGRIDVGIPSSGGPRDNVTLLRFDKSGHQPRSINVGVGALWGAFAASDGSTVVVRTDGQARTRVLRVSASGRIVRNRLVSLPLGGAAYDADGSASPVETNFLDPVDLDRNDALVFAGGMNLVRYADFAATLGNGAGLTASRFALARLNQQDRPGPFLRSNTPPSPRASGPPVRARRADHSQRTRVVHRSPDPQRPCDRSRSRRTADHAASRRSAAASQPQEIDCQREAAGFLPVAARLTRNRARVSGIQRPAWITSQTCAPLGGAQRVAAYMLAAAREQVVRPFALEPGPGRAHPLVDDAVWPALQAHGRTSDIAALLDVTQFDDTHARREALTPASVLLQRVDLATGKNLSVDVLRVLEWTGFDRVALDMRRLA